MYLGLPPATSDACSADASPFGRSSLLLCDPCFGFGASGMLRRADRTAGLSIRKLRDVLCGARASLVHEERSSEVGQGPYVLLGDAGRGCVLGTAYPFSKDHRCLKLDSMKSTLTHRAELMINGISTMTSARKKRNEAGDSMERPPASKTREHHVVLPHLLNLPYDR